jgi:predicted dehydrogenase
MEKKIRIGIIGAGENTRNKHIPGFQAIAGVEVVSVCNRRPTSSRSVADQFGIPKVVSDWREVIADPDVDAVCIGTWPYLHCDATIEALHAGKHVLCEARMGMNLTDAVDMTNAAKAHPNLIAQLVPAPMSLDFDHVIRNTLDREELGDIREIVLTHYTRSNIDREAPMHWRQDSDLSGCNVLNLGIFYEMLHRWYPHEPEWLSADAAIYTPYRDDKISGKIKEVKVPDALTVLGRYRSGTRMVLNMTGVDAGLPVSEIRIHGTEGSLRVDFLELYLFFARMGHDYEIPIDVPRQTRRGWRVEQDFIQSIRTGKPVELTSFEDGLKYMRFTQRVYNSWSNGGIRT